MDINLSDDKKKRILIIGGIVGGGLLLLLLLRGRSGGDTQTTAYMPSNGDDAIGDVDTGSGIDLSGLTDGLIASNSAMLTQFSDSQDKLAELITKSNTSLIESTTTNNQALLAGIQASNQSLYDGLSASIGAISTYPGYSDVIANPTANPMSYDDFLLYSQSLQEDIRQQISTGINTNPNPGTGVPISSQPTTSSVSAIPPTSGAGTYANNIAYWNSQRQIGVSTGNKGLVTWAEAQIRNASPGGSASSSSSKKTSSSSSVVSSTPKKTTTATTTAPKPSATSSTTNKTNTTSGTKSNTSSSTASQSQADKLKNDRDYAYSQLKTKTSAASQQYLKKQINEINAKLKKIG